MSDVRSADLVRIGGATSAQKPARVTENRTDSMLSEWRRIQLPLQSGRPQPNGQHAIDSLLVCDWQSCDIRLYENA